MTIVTYKWNDVSNQAMSRESIGRRHEPAAKYRISPCTFDHQRRIVGVTRAGTLYVESGVCHFTMSGQCVVLRENCVAEFPDGDYVLELVSPGELRVIYVWEIPEFEKTSKR